MIARWSGVASGNRVRLVRRAPKGDLEVERRRVSHGARWRSPEVMFVMGARDAKRRL